MSIHVEILIKGPLEELWQRTQNPELHQHWDLRFSSINYLPRADATEPQRFTYTTRIGLGLAIQGTGESVASHDDSRGRRTSALRFWSDDPKSLIHTGAGYWQYVPTDGGVRFITAYNYQTRFGWLGCMVDRWLFRPLMDWATAWSFDRLRLWIEKGVEPAAAMERSLVHLLARGTLAFVWIYQGLVPKLIARHADELTMLTDAGIPTSIAQRALIAIGCAEVLWGLLILLCFRRRWPMVTTIVLMLAATLGVMAHSPAYLLAAFNPVSLNVLVAAMALVDLFVMRDLPTASHCLRTEPESV